ncbi:MAG: hypothetical protein ABI863_00595 [Ginsengibacter sp.]
MSNRPDALEETDQADVLKTGLPAEENRSWLFTAAEVETTLGILL